LTAWEIETAGRALIFAVARSIIRRVAGENPRAFQPHEFNLTRRNS